MFKWIHDFCQDYSIGSSNLSGKDQKPTIKLFLYNLYRKLRGWSPIYKIRMFIQKICRWNHIPDCDLWEADSTMAKRLLPVLYAFKKMERHGFPSSYSEYEKNSGWSSQEEYNKALQEGKVKGGGEKAWEADINHIILSLEYVAFADNNKKITKWYIDNFGMDPYSDDVYNKYKYYTYRNKDGTGGMSFYAPPKNEVSDLKEHITYGNHELLEYIEKYTSAGLEKFGKMFRAFWD